MTFKEPNFASFLSALNLSSLAGSMTKDYILTRESIVSNSLLSTIENTLAAFSSPIGDTFLMMEKDLEGYYRNEHNKGVYPPQPFIREGKLHFREEKYDKIILCPLLMDFTPLQSEIDDVYYTLEAEDKLIPYAKSTIEGINHYYMEAPEGLFEFYPFIGVNPKAHDEAFLDRLLDAYVNTSHKMFSDHKKRGDKSFFGIKLYPPLGTDPWPSDQSELKKMRILYRFCEENRIPIITHCDDQGFRCIDVKDAWAWTNPASWRSVLENYPDLIIDFAHVGRQYSSLSKSEGLLQSVSSKVRKLPSSPWFYSLMDLISDFDNVYSDISFTGCYKDFYTETLSYFDTISPERRNKIEDRLMFGSDFSVNLLKVESYSEYFNIVSSSPFSNELIEKMVTINPMRFLGFLSF